MASAPPTPVPIRLKLPEVVELLVAHFECTEEHAHDLLERAVYGGSLKDITTHYPDGAEFPTEIAAWQAIDWDEGIVTIEPSWAGSPVQELPVIPLFSWDEIRRCFGIDIPTDRMTERKRGGRPLQHDWDAFWIEVCRRVFEDGLPPTQRELVTEMLTSFGNRGDEEINERTVEKKIAKLFKILRSE